LLHAGHQGVKHTLLACAERELGHALDKAEQKSDSSGTLSREQLAYAAADADVLLPLHTALMEKIHQAGLEMIADVEMRCLPAVAGLSGSGVAFDALAWTALAREAEAEATELRQQLDAMAPPRPGCDRNLGGGWNWDSPIQVKQALAAVDVKIE